MSGQQVPPVLATVAQAVRSATEPLSTTAVCSRANRLLPGAELSTADAHDALVTLTLLSAVRMLPLGRWAPGPGPITPLDESVERTWAAERAKRRRKEAQR